VAMGCIAEKFTDCEGVLFIERLMNCEKVIEVLAGFSVFGAVFDYLSLCSIVRVKLQVSHTGAGFS